MIASDVDRIKLLVEKGADVNAPDPQGWTPLQNAARQKKDELVKVLIELGADPNRADNAGMTPLDRRHHARSRAVRARRCSRTAPTSSSLGLGAIRPLALAIAESKYEAAKALMEAGADVSVASGHEGLTPLMIVAAQTGPAEGAHVPAGQHAADRHRQGAASSARPTSTRSRMTA